MEEASQEPETEKEELQYDFKLLEKDRKQTEEDLQKNPKKTTGGESGGNKERLQPEFEIQEEDRKNLEPVGEASGEVETETERLEREFKLLDEDEKQLKQGWEDLELGKVEETREELQTETKKLQEKIFQRRIRKLVKIAV